MMSAEGVCCLSNLSGVHSLAAIAVEYIIIYCSISADGEERIRVDYPLEKHIIIFI
jgi:hypothetical protein